MSDSISFLVSTCAEAFIQQTAGQSGRQGKTSVAKHSRNSLLRELPVNAKQPLALPEEFEYSLPLLEEMQEELLTTPDSKDAQ